MEDRLLQLATQATFVLVALLAIVDYLRHRGERRRDAALAFGSLGGLIAISWLTPLMAPAPEWFRKAAIVLLLLLPYLLIRLVRHVRPVPIWLARLGLAGAIVTSIAVGFSPQPMPVSLTLAIVAYFALATGYAGFVLVRGALTARGEERRRLTFAATGVGLLALVLLFSGAATLFPQAAGTITIASRLTAIASAICFYVGFAPPGWIAEAWRGLRLGGQVVQLVAATTLVTALGTSAAVAWQLRETWSDQIASGQLRSAQLAGEAAGHYLSGARAALAQTARRPGLRESVANDPWDTARLKTILASFQEEAPELANVLVLDPSGVIRDSSSDDRSRIGQPFSDAELIATVLRSGSIQFSEPYRSPGLRNRPAIAIAAPVTSLDGRLRAVLVGIVDLELLSRSLALPGSSGGTRVVLLSPSGLIAVHPDVGWLLRPGSLESPVASTTARLGRLGTVIDVSPDGERLVGHAPVGDVGWSVLVSTPTREIFGPLSQATNRAGLIAVLLIACLVLASAWLARRLFRPLRELNAAAARFGAGYHGARVLPTGASDVRELGERFNEMAAAVAEQAVELERHAAQLEEKNAALEEATRLKSEFLANMSHELRTPLNAIIGFSELLIDAADETDSAARATYLQTIHSSGQHLLALINDVLDLSKVEAGKMELHRELFDLADLVADALATVQPLAARRDIDLVDQSTGAGDLRADPGRIRQVLLNLLSNAIKFTPRGGKVSVATSRLSDGIQITVADTGIGIPREHHERIFQEFQQIDGSASRRHEGTGLGLALSRRFVELHGGRIWVESDVGSGSQFHVFLPGGDRAAVQPVDQLAAPDQVGSNGRFRPLVLVVEDDPRAANLLTLYLVRSGYRVEVAVDGADAINKARSLGPAAITLDVQLPKMDGWDVLRTLKRDPTTRDIPVVIVSVVDNAELGYALGATDYFVKPVDRRALLARLERYRSGTDRHDEPGQVLLIDDDPASLELLGGMLEPEGFDVLRARGGAEGIRLAQRERPDFVVVDLMMPDVDGFAVVEALRADPALRDIPILVVTAKDLTAGDKAMLNGHVAAVFAKGSFAKVEFLSWLNQVTRRASN